MVRLNVSIAMPTCRERSSLTRSDWPTLIAVSVTMTSVPNTNHFFNTHFRPDKFPMDTVIFTGRV